MIITNGKQNITIEFSMYISLRDALTKAGWYIKQGALYYLI